MVERFQNKKDETADLLGFPLGMFDDVVLPSSDSGDVRLEQLDSRSRPCAYCGRTDPGDSHSCVGCGAPVERGPLMHEINVEGMSQERRRHLIEFVHRGFKYTMPGLSPGIPSSPPLRLLRG